MEWTFGIITAGDQDHFLRQIISSIELNNIPNSKYEILIVGNTKIQGQNVQVIPFNEKSFGNKAWITRKKNMIVKYAKFNNLVFQHDYIVYDKNWYKNFVEFGTDWDVCMNRILNLDGMRFRDWVMWPPAFVVDYNDISKTDQMYVSGSYWCAKKEFMIQNPLNENLAKAEGEDVEWSLRIRNKWKYRANPGSIVRLLKQKEHQPQSNSHI